MENTILEVNDIEKSFGRQKILKKISFYVKKGEFVTLLGPSGCGKTTTLRIISGLESPDSGRIVLGGSDVTNTPSEKRKVNTVFQNYALFPHMNVYNNIAYGLKIKNTPKDVMNTKIMGMLAQVEMEGYEKRMPDQLSGGQRQRIAIARALVNEPDVLLLDEPLGALDLKLKQHMQTELKSIQQDLGTTFIYVTHDQDEALNMSNRLIVMDEGNIRQIGTPKEVYDCPKNRFVAEFIGERNIIELKLLRMEGNKLYVSFAGEEMEACVNDGFAFEKGNALAAIHSDKIMLSKTKTALTPIEGTVTQSNYTGALTRTDIVLLKGRHIKKSEYNAAAPYEKGERVFVGWEGKDLLILETMSQA